VANFTGRAVENPDAHYPNGKPFELWPSPMGAHTNLPSAFSPQTGLVYVPVGEQGITINDAGIDPATWRRSGIPRTSGGEIQLV